VGQKKVLKLLVWQAEDGRSFEDPRRGVEYNVKMDLKEM
jgi:hypothetical protein